MMQDADMRAIIELANNANSWTELGGLCGRSFLAAGYALPKGATIQVVDHEMGLWMMAGQSLLTTYTELAQQRPDLTVLLCRADSVKAAKLLKGSDVVFIDASHDYDSVKADSLAWREKCKTICGHDYTDKFPGVMRAVDELFPKRTILGDTVWKWDVA